MSPAKKTPDPPTKVSLRLAKELAPLLSRYHDNLRRAEHLVSIYRDLYGKGRGKRPVHEADLLRAAVVFLHATLEDFLRTIASMYMPTTGADAINEVPLVGLSDTGRPEKFLLGALAKHRDKTVDELIRESITSHLRLTNFNDTNEIARLLTSLSIPVYSGIKKTFPSLQTLMERRHQIVHAADRLDGRVRGRQRAASISVQQIVRWTTAMRQFSLQLTAYVIDRHFKDRYGIDFDELTKLTNQLKAEKKRVRKKKVSKKKPR